LGKTFKLLILVNQAAHPVKRSIAVQKQSRTKEIQQLFA
jgi:hypothetical protein